MSASAATQGNYMPLPGGWATAIVVKNDNPGYQLIVTIVDP